MRVHRIYYKKGKGGRPLYSKNWYVQMKDHVGVVRYFVGFKDKKQTALLGEQIQRLVNFKQAGEKPDGQMTRFINGMSPKLRARLATIGLLDKSAIAAGKILKDHINDFHHALIAKGDTPKQAQQITSRVMRIASGCHFEKYDDIRVEAVINFLNKLRSGQQGMSARTSNFYLKALKQFAGYMIRNGRAVSSPVQYAEELDQSKVRADARHPRRALLVEEVKRLLATTENASTRYGMTGHQRTVLYRLAIETGLRANELRNLVVADFDFVNLSVTARVKHTKSNREDSVPLKRETAMAIQQLVSTKLPTARVFDVPAKPVDMLKEDLANAKILYVDESGRYADFHSLRHTTASLLAASNVHPKTAQVILRHRDISTTMNIYTHLIGGQERKAIDALPDLSGPVEEEKTG